MNHLRRALDSTQDEAIRSFLLEVQRGKIKILSEMLAEYIRKHDYRFANEPKGEEAKSPYRAIEMMVGKPLS